MNKINNKIKSLFGYGKGHQRTKLAKKNITASFLIKGGSIAIGLILVPMTINYLEPTKYGIWITLSSIIGWFGFFDIGLGHGLRNRFAEAIATGQHELARTYVSTTYAILSLIIGSVLLIFYAVNPFIKWNTILNASEEFVHQQELSLLALIVFTFFCLRFVFKLITTILTADQQPAKASFFDLLGKIFGLTSIFILTKTTQGSLLYLGIAISITPLLVLMASSIWFYSGKYKAYTPSIKKIDFSKARDLLSLGVKFFVIQIAALLLYQTNNIIISHLFGPEHVTPYNVAFKYFSLLMMFFSIIKTPFWSAFTEAWAKKEILWIKKIVKKLITLWAILFVIGILMLIVSKWVYTIWIGSKVEISYSLSALVGAWVMLNAWNGVFSTFLNGVGKLKLQLYVGLFSALLNVPLAIFLGKLYGVEGVLIANILLLAIGMWLYPIQYQKIINQKAKNIWNA